MPTLVPSDVDAVHLKWPGTFGALGSRHVGALGSERSAKARRERLVRIGLTPAQIERLDAPAGLAIGSKRPAEIALSILAGVTAARNGVLAD